MGMRKSSVDSKISSFGRPHGLKKIHSGEQFQKDAVSVTRFTDFAWTGKPIPIKKKWRTSEELLKKCKQYTPVYIFVNKQSTDPCTHCVRNTKSILILTHPGHNAFGKAVNEWYRDEMLGGSSNPGKDHRFLAKKKIIATSFYFQFN